MMSMVFLITPMSDHCYEISDAWVRLGASGVTFLEGYELRHVKETSDMLSVPPGIFSMFEIMRAREQHSVTLVCVVEDAQVDALVAEAECRLGDLNELDNGIIYVLPVARVIGRHR